MDDLQQKNEALKADNLRSTVKIAGLQAGLLDVTDLDSLDLAGVAFAEDGSITGVADFIQNLKAAKSHWFRQDNRQDNQPANRDRAGRQIPKLADVSDIAPGSKAARKIEADYLQRYRG